MKRRVDLTGRQYDDLTVMGKAETNKKGRYWSCKCVCGNETTVKQSDLKNRLVTSCGHEGQTETDERPVKKIIVKPVEKTAVKKEPAKSSAKKAAGGTGHVGVSKVELKSGTRYKANISVDGKKKYLGTFTTLEEAVAARKEAEELYRA